MGCAARMLPFIVCAAATCNGASATRILCLGDSITKGVRGGVTGDQTFCSVVGALLTERGASVRMINEGIGGERTDQALKRLDHDVIAKTPRIVTVMYGTNDSAIDAGKTTPRLPLTTYEENLELLVTRLRDADIEPILMTPIPLCSSFVYMKRAPYREHGPNHRLIGYVRAVRRVSARLDVPLVDHFAAWACQALMGVDLNTLTTDGCHPNPVGHALMARTLYPVLAAKVGCDPVLDGKTEADQAAQPEKRRQAPDQEGNLALGRPYEETSHNQHGYSQGLTDGIRDTDGKHGVYATAPDDAYPKLTTIDLGAERTVGKILIHNAADGSTRKVAVSTSRDGTAFRHIGRHEFGCRDGNTATLACKPHPARYVRIAFEDTWENVTHGSPHFMFLREVEVYAE